MTIRSPFGIGTAPGSTKAHEHLDYCLDEFTVRFNRRLTTVAQFFATGQQFVAGQGWRQSL